MSVLSATLRSIEPGVRTTGGRREYMLSYKVLTTLKADGPQVIVAYFQATAGLPQLGKPLSGITGVNDDDGQAYCDVIAPQRQGEHADAGTGSMWFVACHFVTPGDFEQWIDSAGVPTEDPLAAREEIEFAQIQIARPVRKAIYRSGFTGAFAGNRQADTAYPVTNSANVTLDPPLERDTAALIYRLSRWVQTLPAETLDYVNAVNEDEFTISRPAYGVSLVVPQYTARITSLATVLRYVNLQNLWRVSYEVTILRGRNEYGARYDWREEVPDIGLHGRAEEGQPDGHGSTWAAGVVKDGQPPLYRFHTAGPGGSPDMPLGEPVLLDGNGKPIKPSDETVYITWSIYDELPFAPLNL